MLIFHLISLRCEMQCAIFVTMRKFIVFSLLFCTLSAGAQYNIDFGFKLGGANYLGEMGGKEKTRRDFIWDMKLGQTRQMLGLFGRYKINPYVAVQAAFNYGRIQGADELSTNKGRVGRNLSFKNELLEFELRGEGYIYNIADVGRRGRYRMDFKSYAFAGIAALYSNPKARSFDYNNNEWTALQPLQTEGVDYSKWQLTIPMGVGFFFTYKKQHRFGWELGYRMTFTDYLDDASTVYADVNAIADPSLYYVFANRTNEIDLNQYEDGFDQNYTPGSKRGDPTSNDVYMFTALSYSYVIKGPNSFYRSHYNHLFGGRSKGFRRTRAKF